MSDSDSDPSATLSLPSLVLFVVLLAFGARYLFSSRSSPSTTAPRDRVDAQKVDQVAQMFPQLDRRAIAWDLSRNGGSVGATTEKVLSRGFLDTPPPSFQPSIPTAASNAPTTAASASAAPASKTPDLISRYNLASKLRPFVAGSSAGAADDGTHDDGGGEDKAQARAWAASKAERAAMLNTRREEMILKARRRMEEKDRRSEEKGKAVVR